MSFDSLCSFGLAAVAVSTITIASFLGVEQPFRIGVLLVALIGVHALMRRRLWMPREFMLYAAFAAYNALSSLWTSDIRDAIPNMQLTVNFWLELLLFGALLTMHRRRAVLTGMLVGFVLSAVEYSRFSGFPFVYPDDFSYNTIAGMYLFGLFTTVTYGWYRRSKLMPMLLGTILMLLMAATTSIKTNLGVLIGAAGAGVIYIRHSLRAIWRNLLLVALIGALAAYTVGTSDALTERFQAGVDRVTLGTNILVARDEAKGDAGLSMRQNWENLGIRGWLASPVFGNGVESFRGDFGVTSHSTPIDLLYNTGLIGCLLFYSLFMSIALRLWRAHELRGRNPRGLVLGAMACYGFMSLSGTLYYDMFLAVVMAMSAALLSRTEKEASVSAPLSATMSA